MQFKKANKAIVRQKQAVARVDKLRDRLGNIKELEILRSGRRTGKSTAVSTILEYAKYKLIPEAFKDLRVLVGAVEAKRLLKSILDIGIPDDNSL